MSKKETRAVSISTRAAAEHTTPHTTTQCDGNSRHSSHPTILHTTPLTRKHTKQQTPQPQYGSRLKNQKNKIKKSSEEVGLMID